MLVVTRQLKSGEAKNYSYNQINGTNIHDYMSIRLKTNRRQLKEKKGLLPMIHPNEVPETVRKRIVDLRNAEESWATIARTVMLSEYLAKRVYESAIT